MRCSRTTKRPERRNLTELDKDEQFYRDTESIAFPKLDDRQLAMLEPLGAANWYTKRASAILG